MRWLDIALSLFCQLVCQRIFPCKTIQRVWIPHIHYECCAFVSGHSSNKIADHIMYCSSKWLTVSKKSVHIVFLFLSFISHQLQRDTVLQASCLCKHFHFVSVIKFRHLLNSTHCNHRNNFNPSSLATRHNAQ
jgi:hypothetical protein